MPGWRGQEALTSEHQEKRGELTFRRHSLGHQGEEQGLSVKWPVVRDGTERQEDCTSTSFKHSLRPTGVAGFLSWTLEVHSNNSQCAFLHFL